jgi:hypothetical protein
MPIKQYSPVALQGPRFSEGCAAATAANSTRITAENVDRTLARGSGFASLLVLAPRYLNIAAPGADKIAGINFARSIAFPT